MTGGTGPGSGVLRVIVADDQASVREGLVVLLDLLPDIEVIAFAANGQQALDLVAEHHPDAILLDLHMPGMDGTEAARLLTARHPDVAIVVLTTYADDTSIMAALRAGARSYLTKDADRTVIAQALHGAASGLSVLAPTAQATLLSAADAPPSAGAVPPIPAAELPAGLTPREAENSHLDRPGPDQSGDHRDAGAQQPHDQDPHQPDLRQDRLGQPDRSRPVRPRARAGLTAGVRRRSAPGSQMAGRGEAADGQAAFGQARDWAGPIRADPVPPGRPRR